jgi:hypothetical protein
VTDRSEDDVSTRLEALDGLPVRDQWAEILDRADRDVAVTELTARRAEPRGTRWSRILAAAVIAVALVGTGVLVGRTTSPERVVGTSDVTPTGTWTVGPSIPVAAPDVAALPLLESSGREIYGGFRGGHEVVAVDRNGVAHTIPIGSEIVALATELDPADGGSAVLLTRDGALNRIDADGSTHEIAQLGALRSTEAGVAVAGGSILVSGTERGGVIAINPDQPGRTRVVKGVDATIVVGRGDVAWALNQSTGRLARIDVPSLRVTDTLQVGGVVAAAVASDGVYLARPDVAKVTRIDSNMVKKDAARIDRLTSTMSIGDEIWTSASGVLTAYSRSTGQLIGALARPNPDKVIALTSDGRSTWVLSPSDGLRQLVRKR